MNYKKIIYIAFAGTLLLGSCNKEFLGQANPNAIPTADYFQTPNDVMLAVNGAYETLRNNNGMAEGSGLFSEERSDNTGRNDNQSNNGEPFQFNNFSILPSNTFLQSHWNALYNIVNAANYALAGTEIVNFTNQEEKVNYAAQAKFIRALAYFDLVRQWGPIPVVTSPVKSIDEAMKANSRVGLDSVYAQIVADLKDVTKSGLPKLQNPSGVGHASLAAANALLGKVYLTMAAQLGAEHKTENLNNALTYLNAAYDMRGFDKLSSISYESVFDVNQKTTNPELLFQIEYKQGDINYSSRIAANNQAKGETINSRKPSSNVGGNVTKDLVNDYEVGDKRKDFSVKFANDNSVNDWFITKFRDTSALAGENGYGGNDWILLRYADVILMLAEANNELGNTLTAIGFLDEVRKRAGLPDYKTSSEKADYSSKYPTLKLAILHERRVELAFENQRLYDLQRSFTPEEFVAFFKAKKQADYGSAQLSNCGIKDYYYPIPFNDYNLNPTGMYQNTGY